MTNHTLKTQARYFERVLDGSKTFEVREADERDFQAGDTLTLVEVTSVGHPGRVLQMHVTYVLREHEGVTPGYVVMGLRKLGAA